MTATTVFVLLGAGLGFGVWLVFVGWRDAPAGRHWRIRPPQRWDARRIAGTMAAAAIGGVVTEWVVGALLIATAVWSLPRLITSEKAHARQLARIEAIAGWAELMRDTLAAAAGLEQAILASASVAPAAIHTEVNALALRLETGQRLAPSLQTLSNELADPTADLVISALQLAATQQARNIGELLGSLAAAARELASMRLRIATSRARTRASVRIIIGTTSAFAAALVVFNRDYVSAYNTVIGQLVLLVVGGLFAVGFIGLAKITAVPQPARFLVTNPTASEGFR